MHLADGSPSKETFKRIPAIAKHGIIGIMKSERQPLR